MVDATISGMIDPIDQGQSNLCWLASTAMLFEWRKNQSMSMNAVAALLGEPFSTRAKNDNKSNFIAFSEVDLLRENAGFIMEAQQCFAANGWADLLKSRGPLFVIADFSDNEGQRIAHAVVVTAIHGDGTADGTVISFIDPNGATNENMSLADFSGVFEYGAGTDAPFQVMHWP